MNFLTKIIQTFKGGTSPKKVVMENDIKFSALIKNIQQNIIDANESLEFVGIKYIEQFFDKTPEVNQLEVINKQVADLESELSEGNTKSANELVAELKANVTRLHTPDKGGVIHYRPKMTSFEIPTFVNGVWQKEVLTVPLFTLSPIQVPKINALTFTSKVQNVQHDDNEVYVRFLQHKPASWWRKNKSVPNENVTELKISINPETSSAKLHDEIARYEQILRPH